MFCGLFINPPYGFAPEDNLAYAHVVRLHEAGIAQLNARYPGATVLTAWPMSDELTPPRTWLPEDSRMRFTGLRTSAAVQIAQCRVGAGKIFGGAGFFHQIRSAVADLHLGPWSKAMDERYFGLHHDLPPEAIARELGGTLVWKQEDQGQWIALIRFNRQFEAALRMPDRPR